MKYYINSDAPKHRTADTKPEEVKTTRKPVVIRHSTLKSSALRQPSVKQFSPKQNLKPIKRKNNKKRRYLFLIVLIIAIVGSFLAVNYFLGNNKAINLNPVNLVVDKITNQTKQLDSTNGKISAIIFGADMRSNELTYDLSHIGNTDVVLVASYDIATNKLSLISLPRDMAVKFKFPNNVTYNYNKITSGVILGEMGNYPGGGSQLMRDTIYDLTGIKINYSFVVNFKVFSDIVDAVGGVDVNVENSFCDAGYPTDKNGKTEKIIFHKGLQHMDGATALKFARSRVHDMCSDFTSGDPVFEGTDFRRNYRQQQVITAIKAKVAQGKISVDQILSLYTSLSQNILSEVGDVKMDPSKRIDLETVKAFTDNLTKYSSASIANFVIDPNACGKSLAKEGYINGTYYLLPQQPDFANLKPCLDFFLANSDLMKENAVVAVYNTGDPANLSKAKQINDEINTNYIKADFYNTLFTKTAKSSDGKTITDLSKGNYVCDWDNANPVTLAYLAKKYNAKIVTKDQLIGTLKYLGGADILLTLGNPGTQQSSSSSQQ